jgi:hypothetical protein
MTDQACAASPSPGQTTPGPRPGEASLADCLIGHLDAALEGVWGSVDLAMLEAHVADLERDLADRQALLMLLDETVGPLLETP